MGSFKMLKLVFIKLNIWEQIATAVIGSVATGEK
jgi:hypothetical protein